MYKIFIYITFIIYLLCILVRWERHNEMHTFFRFEQPNTLRFDVYWCRNEVYIDTPPFPADFRLPHLCLPSTAIVRILGGDVPFEYKIRICWRTAHTSVYVCLNWPLYGNRPGAAHWKRIDSTRCVSRIEMTPVGRFASRYFRLKGFNIKPLSLSPPCLTHIPRLRPSGIETRERQCGVFAKSISSIYTFFFL